MNIKSSIKILDEVDGIVEILLDRLHQIKMDCHKARRKLEDVSTSSNALKGSRKSYVDVVAKRHNRIFKSKAA